MAKSKIELTAAEWSIMKAVWDHEPEPCTAPAIQEALEKKTGWTYSTVRTLMDRMAAKGALEAEKVRNITLYRSRLTREEAQEGELRYTLKNAFNGALSPMVQCLLQTNDLSEDELAELEALIQKKRKQSK